jgi:HEAT repeat protein/phosphate starvation-inducible membrane PsiE
LDRFLRVLNIQPDESRIASGLFFYSFVIGVAKVFQLTAAQALFLQAYEAADLAWVYMIASVVTIAVSASYLRLGSVLAPRALILTNLTFSMVVTVLMWVALTTVDARWPALALMVWYQALVALASVAFWGAATQVLDIRQGKRLFPVVTTGDVLAFSLGGFFILRTVDAIGTTNLMLIGAAGHALSILALVRITSMKADQFKKPAKVAEGQVRETTVDWKSPYLRLMMAYFMLSAAVFVVLDNAFLDVANTRFTNTADLARFFAFYNMIAAVVTFFFRSMGAGRMVQRFGLIAGLLGLPLALLIGSTTIAVVGFALPALGLVFWAATMTRLFDKVFRGVQATSFATLYQPLMEKGPSVQATLDGIIDSAALGLAGLVLLVLHHFFDITAVHLSIILIGLSAIWVAATFRLRREYVSTLAKVLHRRRIRGEPLHVLDGDVLDLVSEELESDHDENVLYAVQLLETADYERLDQVLTELLYHESADVRGEVLRLVETHNVTDAIQRVREIIADPSETEAIRGRAVRVAGALSEEIFPEVMEAMHADSSELRRGALVGLLKSGSIEGIVYAGAELLEDLRSSSARDRIFASQVLRDAEIPSFYRQAIQLLNDRDIRVRIGAIEAAAKMGHPPLWPLVVDTLREPDLAGAASHALIEAGPEAVSSLLYGFERHTEDRQFRLAILRILGLIGNDEAVAYLADLVHEPSREIRHAALSALSKSPFQPSSVRTKSFRIQLRVEVRDCGELYVVGADLRDKLSDHALLRAVDEEIHQAQHRLFLLLAPLFPAKDVLGAWESFRSEDKTRRAYALEFLENCLTNEDRAWMFPVLEDLPEVERIDLLSKTQDTPRMSCEDRLQWALEAEELSSWTRICAKHAASSLGLTQGPPTATESQIYERAMRLRGVELFGRMGDHVLAALAPRLQPVDLREGDVVFHKGDIGDCMYLVLDGRVHVHDNLQSLAHLERDQVFGEFTVLHSGKRTASVTAETSTELLRFTQTDLYDLLTDQAAVARTMIRMIVKRLRENQATRANA